MPTKCDCVCIPREEYERLKNCNKASKPKSTKRKRATRPKIEVVAGPVIPKAIAAPKTVKAKTKASKPKAIKQRTTTKKNKTVKAKTKASKPKKTSRISAKKNNTVKYALPQIEAPRDIPYHGHSLEKRVKGSSNLRLSAPKVDLSGIKDSKAVTSFREDLKKLKNRPKKERMKELSAPREESRALTTSTEDRTFYLQRRNKELPGRRDEPLALPSPRDDGPREIVMEDCSGLPYFKRKACERRNRQRVS